MKNGIIRMGMVLSLLFIATSFLSAQDATTAAPGKTAVSLILKNNSASSVTVELIDQYGGNFTATVEPGTSQNQTLKVNSEVKIGEVPVHVVVPADEGMEVIVAGE